MVCATARGGKPAFAIPSLSEGRCRREVLDSMLTDRSRDPTELLANFSLAEIKEGLDRLFRAKNYETALRVSVVLGLRFSAVRAASMLIVSADRDSEAFRVAREYLERPPRGL